VDKSDASGREHRRVISTLSLRASLLLTSTIYFLLFTSCKQAQLKFPSRYHLCLCCMGGRLRGGSRHKAQPGMRPLMFFSLHSAHQCYVSHRPITSSAFTYSLVFCVASVQRHTGIIVEMTATRVHLRARVMTAG